MLRATQDRRKRGAIASQEANGAADPLGAISESLYTGTTKG